jgi:hypothetical protein
MKLNIQQMMKQAKKMQEQLAKQQEELAGKTFEASSGGGMVTATVNGKFELLNLKVDPEVVDKEDIDMLQDLVVAAVNEATRQAQEAAQNLMGGLMGGAGMPDLGGMLG